jgi:fumarate hydratase class II
MQMRIEHDTMGEVAVPNNALWGRKLKEVCKTSK